MSPQLVPEWGLPPDDIGQEWVGLADALDQKVPAKKLDRNVLIASWNIREFGRSNGKWITGPQDSPKRNRADIYFIAEILSRFDVVAVQEVQNNLSALREVIACLGSDWGFQVTDVTAGEAAANERLAYIYDLRRVRPSGLAGELVLSPEDLDPPDGGPLVPGLDHQVVHTPYVMSFLTANRPFVLATVHIIWGEDDELEPRAREAEAVAKMLHRIVAPASDEPDQSFRANLILLGDFNVTNTDDVTFRALVQSGLQPDVGTLDAPRGPADDDDSDITYDQVAWFPSPQPGALSFERVNGGTFPWDEHILVGEPGNTTFRISDHYPLWIEFSVREAHQD